MKKMNAPTLEQDVNVAVIGGMVADPHAGLKELPLPLASHRAATGAVKTSTFITLECSEGG